MGIHETEKHLYYIRDTFSQDTGGGFLCDIMLLDDGCVLVISEEAIVMYKDLETWENNPKKQEGVIYRTAAY